MKRRYERGSISYHRNISNEVESLSTSQDHGCYTGQMQLTLLVTLNIWLFLLSIAHGRPPASSTVSMSTTSQMDGIESINVMWQVPFKMENFVTGFRYR